MQKRPAGGIHVFFLLLALAGISFLDVRTAGAAGQRGADKPARTLSGAAAAKAETRGLPGVGKEENVYAVEPVENVLKPPKQEKTGRMDVPAGQEQSALSAAEKAKQEEMRKRKAKAGRGDGWFRKGLEHGAEKEYDKAIEAYTMAIRHDTTDASGYYNRGVIFQKCARYDLAIRDYTKASQITPDDPDIYYNRGLSYHSIGESDLAIKDYTRAIALSRSDSYPFWNRAVAFSRAGRQDLALADYCMAEDLSRLEAKTKAKAPH